MFLHRCALSKNYRLLCLYGLFYFNVKILLPAEPRKKFKQQLLYNFLCRDPNAVIKLPECVDRKNRKWN